MYPTASAPQYAFGPALAPVPMPGMAGGGLAALPVKRFQRGGLSDTPVGGLFSPIAEVGPLSVTPANVIGMVAPPVVSVPLGLLGAYNSFMAKQDPAPIMEAKTAAEVEAQQAQMQADIAAAQDAEDAAQGLAMMNQTQAQPAQEVSPVDVAMDVAATVAATQDAVDAEAGAANAAAAQGPGAMDQGIGGISEAMGGDGSTPGAPGDAPSIGGSMDAGGSNNSGTDAGSDGASPSYQYGGRVMNYAEGGETSGRYQYTYNPENQTYTQISGPGMASGASGASGMTNFGSGLGALIKGHNINENPTQEDLDKFLSAFMRRYSQGGIAAAQQAQSKGRGQDTMLVHMTPGEVKGLQALAMSQGGSLTINPQTGLPEAGFLSSILPMIAGFALGPAGFGLMSSLGAGATVGALTGIATGSLKKGLMAGLGAYGGAGLGEGLIGAGNVTAPVTTGTEAGLTSAADVATSNLSPELLNSPVTTSTSGIDPSLLEGRGLTPNSPYFKMAQSNIDPGVLEGMGGTPGMTAQQVATAPVINPTPAVPTSPTVGFERTGEGFRNMFDTGQVGTDARSAFMKATPTGSLTAAGTTVASALTPEPAPLEKSKSFIRPFDLDITNPSGTPQYTPQDTRERTQVQYAYRPREIYEVAQGGQIDSDYNMAVGQNGAFSDAYKEGGLSALAKRRKALAGDKYYKFAQDRRDASMKAAVEQNFAKGGLPPRFLQGAGDGMSDSIKARIGGVQEARLADGEFVIPADVVSHLGNGSSKAGAKKLYSMMDKIRKARTGRTRQAPEVNPNKYMPA